MSDDQLDYPRLLRNSKRRLVHDIISKVAQDGMPGQHHFYITFRTRDDGVDIDPELVARYPDEMTIVLEHQYWDLGVDEDAFEVTLKFNRIPKYLRIPFAAISQLHDPSQNFMIAIEQFDDERAEAVASAVEEEISDNGGEAAAESGTVVSLDQFRKKTS